MTNVVGFLFPVSGIERHTLLSAHTWQIEVSACGWKKWSAQTLKAERQEHTVKKICFFVVFTFGLLAFKAGAGFWH